ncbi:MAG: YjiH family protein [Cellulosilyticaceae bacterium]
MSQNNQIKLNKYTFIDKLKFIIPSLIGVFLFMLPIQRDGQVTIPIAVLSGGLQDVLAEALPITLAFIVCLSLVGTLIYKILKPNFMIKSEFLTTLFNVSPIWFVVRILATCFILATVLGKGPEAIISGNTGGLILFDLLPILFSVFFFAGLFLPLLLNFGLLEFVGSLFVKIMRPVFKLPGRSAIDCMTSWLGDGTIGVLLTSKQFEQGLYTKREASIIGTSFSLVSVTFTLVIIDTVGLGHMFIPFYLTVSFACIIAAILLPKFGPLSKKEDVLIDGSAPTLDESIPAGFNSFSYGVEKALDKAHKQNIIRCIFIDGFKNVIDMWFAVIPIVMAVGTVALMIAEFTPVFKILGLPFFPLLAILGVPEALAASSTLMAGFADMLLPSILASGIESEMTRFVVACVSVSQLIYLSEVGALLLGSKIPVSLKELFFIFIQRTIITLPIIAVIAHLLF